MHPCVYIEGHKQQLVILGTGMVEVDLVFVDLVL